MNIDRANQLALRNTLKTLAMLIVGMLAAFGLVYASIQSELFLMFIAIPIVVITVFLCLLYYGYTINGGTLPYRTKPRSK